MLKENLRKKSGITLVALVVTIVVLLILAGVSINLVLSNSGIISRTNEAKKEYAEAKANEESDLESAVDWIDEQATGQVSLAKVPVGTKASKNGTINGEAGSAKNPVIPKGYIPIDTETSSWGDGSSAPDVAHGLVITDAIENGNEWVWVPVEDVSVMCNTESRTEYTLCGTSVKTKLYSQTIISGLTRGYPGTSTSKNYREPDLITDYDTKEVYYKTILGFESSEKMAEAFVEDYEEMIKSIATYGGFYIGRYELSEEGVKMDREVLADLNWYDAYKKCKGLNASEKVETRMIWGCQWDVTMNWLVDSGAKTSDEVFTDSSTWGNYYNTSVKADDGETEIKASKSAARLNTGVTTFTMANNIYDLAGNCFEWTQEAESQKKRISRGGTVNHDGDTAPASYYSAGLSANRDSIIGNGSRPTLIIK